MGPQVPGLVRRLALVLARAWAQSPLVVVAVVVLSVI